MDYKSCAVFFKTSDVLLGYIRRKLWTYGFYEGSNEMLRDLYCKIKLPDCAPAMHLIKFDHELEGMEYASMAMTCYLTSVDIESDNAEQQYLQLIDTLHPDWMIRWTSLAMVLIATGKLIVKALKDGMEDQVVDIVSWCLSAFTHKHFDAWVELNGGWRNIDLRVDDDNAEQVFGKFIRNCVEEEADSEGESNSTTPLSSEAIAAARRVVEYVENWYTNGRINSRRDN